MSSQQPTSNLILCFFTQCKHRQDEGQCGFSGTIIIAIEGDCQCMERRRVETTFAVSENVSSKF
jgi:hypothetical protein